MVKIRSHKLGVVQVLSLFRGRCRGSVSRENLGLENTAGQSRGFSPWIKMDTRIFFNKKKSVD